MTSVFYTALVLLILFHIKHTLADYFMQTARMLASREIYLHAGRAQHAALHAAFSFGCLLIVGAHWGFALILCLLEFVVHFHIDWAKGRYSERAGHTPSDRSYWRAFGIDQLLHMLTYVAMIWAWVSFGQVS